MGDRLVNFFTVAALDTIGIKDDVGISNQNYRHFNTVPTKYPSQ